MSTLLVMLPLSPLLYMTNRPIQALFFACVCLLVGSRTPSRNAARLRALGLGLGAALLAGLWPCQNCRLESGLHPLEHVLWAEGAAVLCVLLSMLAVGLRYLGKKFAP